MKIVEMEKTITLTDSPELRFSPSGRMVVSFYAEEDKTRYQCWTENAQLAERAITFERGDKLKLKGSMGNIGEIPVFFVKGWSQIRTDS